MCAYLDSVVAYLVFCDLEVATIDPWLSKIVFEQPVFLRIFGALADDLHRLRPQQLSLGVPLDAAFLASQVFLDWHCDLDGPCRQRPLELLHAVQSCLPRRFVDLLPVAAVLTLIRAFLVREKLLPLALARLARPAVHALLRDELPRVVTAGAVEHVLEREIHARAAPLDAPVVCQDVDSN